MSEGAGGERCFKVVVKTDAAGTEHLSIEPLIDPREAPREGIPHDHLIDLARRIYDTRRARTRYFHDSLLGEPMWDMLLALFCLPSRGERLAVTSLANAADIPPTTGLRWIERMERHELIERTQDPRDRRRVYLKLTDKGAQLMRDFLAAIYHQLTAA